MPQTTPPPAATLEDTMKFQRTDAFAALEELQQARYVRDDAFASGYAWGRHDAGHPPIVSLKKGEAPSTTDTVWAFGSLYARMNLELNDPAHPRSGGLSVQSAWDEFAKTGCPDGNLPERVS